MTTPADADVAPIDRAAPWPPWPTRDPPAIGSRPTPAPTSANRVIRRSGVVGLVHGLCEELPRRARRRAPERADDHVGVIALAARAGQSEHDDDPLDDDEHLQERHAPRVARPVGCPETPEGVDGRS